MSLRPLPAIATAVVVFLAACADRPADPDDRDRIDHSIAHDDVLVRISYEGGFTPIEWSYTSLPVFSLYGDGTVVVPGAQIEIYPPPALPAIVTRNVDEAGVQAILREAIGATTDVPENLDDMGSVAITDVPTTAITVAAGEIERTVRVYALGELLDRPDGMPPDVFRARQELQTLVTKLSGLDPWLPTGSLGLEQPYRATAAKLFVRDHRKIDDLPQEEIAWPLATNLARFGDPADPSGTYRCGVVGGEDWTTVHEAATRANQLTPWIDRHRAYTILFRPLLPDEQGC